MSQIPLSKQLFSHVISLASCPGKCQAPNVCLFALVVLRSYWNPSGGLFCIRLPAESDIEKKQVELERGALDCVVFNSDSRRPVGLAASELPSICLWLLPFVLPSVNGQSFVYEFLPFCTQRGLSKLLIC